MDTAFPERLIPFGGSGYAVLCRMDDDRATVLTVRYQREAEYS